MVAVSLNQIALGLGLIVAFSLGLAAVLIAVGVLLVRTRTLVTRVSAIGAPVQHFLPLGSAIVVSLLGVGIVLTGLTAYLG